MPKERPSMERAREVAREGEAIIDSSRGAEDAIDRNKKRVGDLADRHQKGVQLAKKGLDAVGARVEGEELQIEGLRNALTTEAMGLIDQKNLLIDEGNKVKVETGNRLGQLSISAGTDDGSAQMEVGIDKQGPRAKGSVKQGPLAVSAEAQRGSAELTAQFDGQAVKAKATLGKNGFQGEASLDQGSLSANVRTNGESFEGQAAFNQGPVNAEINLDDQGISGKGSLKKGPLEADVAIDKKGLRGKAKVKHGPFSGKVEADTGGAKGEVAVKTERFKGSAEFNTRKPEASKINIEVDVLDNERVQLTLTADVSQQGGAAGGKFNVKKLPITAILNVSGLEDPRNAVYKAAAGLNLGENVSITFGSNIQGGNQSHTLNLQGRFGVRG